MDPRTEQRPHASCLADRAVVVTGGASGIGLAVAQFFVARAARVFVLDIQDTFVDDVEGEFLKRASLIRTDLRDPEAIKEAFRLIGENCESIKVLVNNAGISDVDLIETEPLATWRAVMDVNLTAPFLCLQAAIPLLRAALSSSVINVASIAGKRMSYNGGAAYTASKAGVLGLTRHAAFELARYGVRVNAVCPGPTLTPMILSSTSAAQREKSVDAIPLRNWITPEQIAEAVGFLADDASGMCTGISIDVDGGFLVSSGVPYDEYFKRRAQQ
ncbi:MAG: SDR family oxidoreductase [Hyphomonadaceae bacterium]|nr:SDR family oxidoreductase [Hyphomonadaceae bacterium]